MADFARYVAILMIVLSLAAAASLIRAGITGFFAYSSGTNSSLGIWDQTESKGGAITRYTYPTSFEQTGECYKSQSLADILFFANYSNSSDVPINAGMGNCQIRYDRNDDLDYNDTGEGWINMSFNASSGFWENMTNLTYKGILNFQVNCTSPSYDNLLLTDSVSINNTGPCIFGRIGGLSTNPLPPITCYENSICSYDFSQNCTDDDQNDLGSLTYDYNVLAKYDPYFGMTAEGVLQVNITNLSSSQLINVQLFVADDETPTSTSMNITVNPINDAPLFDTLPTGATEDLEFNSSSPGAIITATDEEGDYPLNININITGCDKASWVSGPWRDNCTLFSWNQTSGTTAEILNFTPTNWDVGDYTVNFTVIDSGDTIQPHNATYSTEITFTVANVNDRPNITAVNGTDIVLFQGDAMYLVFNGTDIENDTLNFTAITLYQNLSALNNTELFPITKNDTMYPNESAYGIMDFIISNGQVGNYTINVTVMDNGTSPDNLTDYILVNVTIYNTNDPPALENFSDSWLAIQEEESLFYFNASDPDFLTVYLDNLTFGFNFTACSTLNGSGNCNDFGENSTFAITKLGNTSAYFRIIAERDDTGNYTLNLTVTDSGGLVNWTCINLTVVPDWAPSINAPSYLEMNQAEDFWFVFNVTDAENDTLNITHRTLYRNLTFLSFSLFFINFSNATYPPYYNATMNYTPVSNDQVGNYTIEVNATDVWNRTSGHLLNVTVWNVNDNPQVINFTSCYDPDVTYPLDLTVPENAQNCFLLTNPDLDLLTPYGDDLTYVFTFKSCSASGTLPPGGNCSGSIPFSEYGEVGMLNFTADDESWQGNYSYNLSFTDGEGAYASAIINISIYAVNDPPTLVSLAIENSSSNGTKTTYYFPINDAIPFTEGQDYNLTLTAVDEEDNTPLYYDVSFTCILDTPGPCGLFSFNGTTGEANLTPADLQTGNYTANMTAKDSGTVTAPHNATGWELVNMTVLATNDIPNIVLWSCQNSDCSNLMEGTSKLFWHRANDPDGQPLTCYFYLDWMQPTQRLTETKTNCNSTSNVMHWFAPGYDDALNYTNATRNFTLVAEDTLGLKNNKTLLINIYNVNRPPRLAMNISTPITWQSRTSMTAIDLDNYFEDDYGEVLSYSYQGASNVDVAINPITNEVTLTPKGGWYGTDWIVFVANDSALTNTSNNVTLMVIYKPPETVPSPSTSYPSPRVASLEIMVPEIITLEAGRSTLAKVVLHNDGQYDLLGINLSAITNETNISLALMQTFFPEIKIGYNATTWLNISTGELNVNETYLVQLLGDVSYPDITESATVTIRPLRTNKTDVIVKIILVKDMFEENPECMELFGLILEAEEALNRGDIAEARRLTQLAIDNCQDMIDYAALRRNQTASKPPSTVGQIIMNPLFIMGFVLALLAFSMLGYWLMIRRQQPIGTAQAVE
ncbi:MAG: hypothetical protein JXC85_02685 [Candidatus Aenigmarchaeota archaeon]|nr:hypothetical protein [Candidatus Aenigmarchaeota archaeon]